MPKSSGQKLKLLYLRDILLKRTDDNHGMTATEIIDALSEFNIKSERKSLYDDISSLQMYGLDIEKIKSNTTRYYVASRDFELRINFGYIKIGRASCRERCRSRWSPYH